MQELALLVAMTGQQLDNIQNTINQAGDYTTHAEGKLIDAKKSHKSARKVKIIVCIENVLFDNVVNGCDWSCVNTSSHH